MVPWFSVDFLKAVLLLPHGFTWFPIVFYGCRLVFSLFPMVSYGVLLFLERRFFWLFRNGVFPQAWLRYPLPCFGRIVGFPETSLRTSRRVSRILQLQIRVLSAYSGLDLTPWARLSDFAPGQKGAPDGLSVVMFRITAMPRPSPAPPFVKTLVFLFLKRSAH